MMIGKGESVNVWRDPWLPDSNHMRISTPVYPGLEEAKVCSLMKSDSMKWDIDILRDLFNDNDIQHILKILLSASRVDDSWLWLDGSNGAYSVKSAYRRLCQAYSIDQSLGDVNWLEV